MITGQSTRPTSCVVSLAFLMDVRLTVVLDAVRDLVRSGWNKSYAYGRKIGYLTVDGMNGETTTVSIRRT